MLMHSRPLAKLLVWLPLLFLFSGAAERKIALEPLEIAMLTAITPGAVETARGSNRNSKKGLAAPVRLVSVLHDKKALAGIHDVQLQGRYAYVAGKGPGGTIEEGMGSFAIIDITDPRKPVITGRITEEITNGETVLLDGDICYLGSNHFWSVDIRDKHHPKVLCKIEDPAIKSINGMVRLGSYVYAASKSGHITVFDIRDPKAPKLAAVFRTKGNFGSPHDIDRWDDQRVVVVNIRANKGEEQLRVYKVSAKGGEPLPPEQWVLEGTLDDQRLRGANRVRVRDNVAFVMGNKGYSVGAVALSQTGGSPVLSDWFSTTEDPRYRSCGMDLAGEVMIADVVGPICETGDTFARERMSAPLAANDLIAIMSAGAYGAVMASSYNTRPLVPEVLVDGNRFAVTRRRPTYEEILAAETLPDWLLG